jgi:hypothetical protein
MCRGKPHHLPVKPANVLVYGRFSVTLQGSVENDGRFAHFLFVAQD